MSGYLGTMTATGAGLQLPGVRLEGLGAARGHDARRGRLVGGAAHAAVRHLQVPAGQGRRRRSGRPSARRHARVPSRRSRARRERRARLPDPARADDPRRRRDRGDRAIRRAPEPSSVCPDPSPRESGDMDLGNGLGHLTYSTLVHPGDTWDDMWESLHDVRAAGEGARLARRAVRRVAAARRRLGRDARGKRGGARQAQGLSRRQRPVPLHGQRVPVRAVQGRPSSRSRSTSRTGAPRSARNTR